MDSLRRTLDEGLGAGFRIEREIGGGMSRVFLATETALDRAVVLKVLPPELAAGFLVHNWGRTLRQKLMLTRP